MDRGSRGKVISRSIGKSQSSLLARVSWRSNEKGRSQVFYQPCQGEESGSRRTSKGMGSGSGQVQGRVAAPGATGRGSRRGGRDRVNSRGLGLRRAMPTTPGVIKPVISETYLILNFLF